VIYHPAIIRVVVAWRRTECNWPSGCRYKAYKTLLKNNLIWLHNSQGASSTASTWHYTGNRRLLNFKKMMESWKLKYAIWICIQKGGSDQDLDLFEKSQILTSPHTCAHSKIPQHNTVNNVDFFPMNWLQGNRMCRQSIQQCSYHMGSERKTLRTSPEESA